MSTRGRSLRVSRALRTAGSALLALLALAAGCESVGPDYVTPEATTPQTWHDASGGGLTEQPAELATWWRQLDDPVLDDLVGRAQAGSLDVRESLARVRESRALLGEANAGYYPTIDGLATWDRTVQSENTVFGEFIPDATRYGVGFDAVWELDLWGRVRRSVEAAGADYEASLEDARDVAVSVTAETAVNYVQFRGFQQRVEIARTNVALQEQTEQLVRARFEAGLVSESDLAQARTNLEATRSRVPSLEIGLRAAENRLAVLLGLTPGMLATQLAEDRPIPVPPVAVAVGVPADLLRRRPDVRRAERVLAAQTARIGVAAAELYPQLALNGNLGLAAEHSGDVFEDGSDEYHFGPSLRWNLFDAGRLRDRVEAQDARTEQALVRWEQSVLTALEESENAMTAFVREQTRRASLNEAVTQARRAVDLSRTQYTEGLADFQTVLVAERALAELEDDLAQSDAAITTSLVALYKALGGGWDPQAET